MVFNKSIKAFLLPLVSFRATKAWATTLGEKKATTTSTNKPETLLVSKRRHWCLCGKWLYQGCSVRAVTTAEKTDTFPFPICPFLLINAPTLIHFALNYYSEKKFHCTLQIYCITYKLSDIHMSAKFRNSLFFSLSR